MDEAIHHMLYLSILRPKNQPRLVVGLTMSEVVVAYSLLLLIFNDQLRSFRNLVRVSLRFYEDQLNASHYTVHLARVGQIVISHHHELASCAETRFDVTWRSVIVIVLKISLSLWADAHTPNTRKNAGVTTRESDIIPRDNRNSPWVRGLVTSYLLDWFH